jgi:hypothetical protein
MNQCVVEMGLVAFLLILCFGVSFKTELLNYLTDRNAPLHPMYLFQSPIKQDHLYLRY